MGMSAAGPMPSVRGSIAGWRLPFRPGCPSSRRPQSWKTSSRAGRLLHISDKPQKSETVLIHAAAGGIGSAAVQPAKAAGATELATASAGNIGNVLSQGAEAVFDYQRSDFEAEVVDATASCGVDLIIDFVGGSYLVRNIRSLAPGGRLVQVGLLGRDDNAIIPLGTVLQSLAIAGHGHEIQISLRKESYDPPVQGRCAANDGQRTSARCRGTVSALSYIGCRSPDGSRRSVRQDRS